jgi:hypothetical protein
LPAAAAAEEVTVMQVMAEMVLLPQMEQLVIMPVAQMVMVVRGNLVLLVVWQAEVF